MKRILGMLFAAVVVVSLMMVPAASVGANPDPGIVWQIGVFDDLYGVTDGTKITTSPDRSLAPTGTVTVDYTDVSTFYSVLVPVTTITGTFTADLSKGAVLLVSWCPGKSGTEQFSVALDGATQSSKTVPGLVCTDTYVFPYPDGRCGWAPPYYPGKKLPYYTEILDFGSVGSGTETHSLSISYTQGDGIGFDYLKLSTPSAKELKKDATDELEAIKDLLCLGKCKGVALLTLIYHGADGALIEAISKGKTYFDGNVVPGDSFEIAAIDEKLGANTKIYVNGVLATEIHTSCSRPLRVGMRFGDFEVEGVDSLNEADNAIKHINKSLAPELWEDARHLDAKHGKKVFDEEKKAVKYLMAICKCKGIRSLTLEYSGGAGADVTVDKGIVTDNGDGTYTITPEEGKSKLAANSKIYVDGVLNTKIHTSCSKPLKEGDAYGSFKVVGVVKVKGKVVFKDNFGSYSPGDDGSPVWTPVTGDWSVESDIQADGSAGQVYSQNDINDTNAQRWSLAGDASWTDYVVEAKVKGIEGHYSGHGDNTWNGLVFRAVDDNHFYEYYFRTTSQDIIVVKHDGATRTVVSGPVPFTCQNGVWYKLKVVAEGSSFRFYANDVELAGLAFADSSFASGKVGVYVWDGTHAHFDDVSVLCRCKPEVVAEVHKVIGKLVKADEALARTAIHEAETTTVIDEKNQDKYDREIAKAREELAKAEEELENKRPDKAIDHKKKAWEHAQHAIKEALKPAKPPKP